MYTAVGCVGWTPFPVRFVGYGQGAVHLFYTSLYPNADGHTEKCQFQTEKCQSEECAGWAGRQEQEQKEALTGHVTSHAEATECGLQGLARTITAFITQQHWQLPR